MGNGESKKILREAQSEWQKAQWVETPKLESFDSSIFENENVVWGLPNEVVRQGILSFLEASYIWKTLRFVNRSWNTAIMLNTTELKVNDLSFFLNCLTKLPENTASISHRKLYKVMPIVKLTISPNIEDKSNILFPIIAKCYPNLKEISVNGVLVTSDLSSLLKMKNLKTFSIEFSKRKEFSEKKLTKIEKDLVFLLKNWNMLNHLSICGSSNSLNFLNALIKSKCISQLETLKLFDFNIKIDDSKMTSLTSDFLLNDLKNLKSLHIEAGINIDMVKLFLTNATSLKELHLKIYVSNATNVMKCIDENLKHLEKLTAHISGAVETSILSLKSIAPNLQFLEYKGFDSILDEDDMKVLKEMINLKVLVLDTFKQSPTRIKSIVEELLFLEECKVSTFELNKYSIKIMDRDMCDFGFMKKFFMSKCKKVTKFETDCNIDISKDNVEDFCQIFPNLRELIAQNMKLSGRSIEFLMKSLPKLNYVKCIRFKLVDGELQPKVSDKQDFSEIIIPCASRCKTITFPLKPFIVDNNIIELSKLELEELENLDFSDPQNITDDALQHMANSSWIGHLKKLSFTLPYFITEKEGLVPIVAKFGREMNSLSLRGPQLSNQTLGALSKNILKNRNIFSNLSLEASHHIEYENILRLFRLEQMKSLQYLSLSECPSVNDECLEVIVRNVDNLKSLKISKCYKVTDKSASKAAQKYSLSKFEADNCNKITINGTCKTMMTKGCNEISVEAFDMELVGSENKCFSVSIKSDISQEELEFLSSHCGSQMHSLKISQCPSITNLDCLTIKNAYLKEFSVKGCSGISTEHLREVTGKLKHLVSNNKGCVLS